MTDEWATRVESRHRRSDGHNDAEELCSPHLAKLFSDLCIYTRHAESAAVSNGKHQRHPLRTGRWTAKVVISLTVSVGGCSSPETGPILVTVPGAASLASSPLHRQGEEPLGGWIPDGQPVSPLDMTNLAIIRLNPRLLAALQAAARTAAAEGVQVEISSGWRSKRFQQLLLDEHAQTHKNPRTAAETVISPGLFKHVSGDAVDVPAATADWLASHGAEFGLCQVYAEEPWHFELLATAHGSCPTLRQGLVAAEDQGAH